MRLKPRIWKETLNFSHALPMNDAIKVRAYVDAQMAGVDGFRKYMVNFHINRSGGLTSFDITMWDAGRGGEHEVIRSMRSGSRLDLAQVLRDEFLKTTKYRQIARELGWLKAK